MDKLEAKVKWRIGPGNRDGKSMMVLSRMVHWTPMGIEYAADQRRVEIIVVD